METHFFLSKSLKYFPFFLFLAEENGGAVEDVKNFISHIYFSAVIVRKEWNRGGRRRAEGLVRNG